MTDLDHTACYRALKTRDTRFDGRFYTCVVSTGIFCRPVCPAPTPKAENCLFMPSAAAAHAAGFRPCLRCRPELAPGVAGWRGTINTVNRALHLIADGALNDNNVDHLAGRLGVGERHLRRLFAHHVGASPISVAQAQRILFAKKLIHESALPMTEVALASGFGSIRQFNDIMRRALGRPPSDLKRNQNRRTGHDGLVLRLPFNPPYDWPTVLNHLALRAVPGVEEVRDGRYRRTIYSDGVPGIVEVAPTPDGLNAFASIHTQQLHSLGRIVSRLRRQFDLDADIGAISTYLGAYPRLRSSLELRPGLRVPGAWDEFELAVRAVLGQRVSVAAATSFAGKLAFVHGEPVEDATLNRLFPSPEKLADADLTQIGFPTAIAKTISGLARGVIENPGLLQPYATLEETTEALCRLPGIGPWTAHYVAMRALREPDAFPASDLGLLRALETEEGRPTPAQLLEWSEEWRPWRAYAAMHLWMIDADRLAARRKTGKPAKRTIGTPT